MNDRMGKKGRPVAIPHSQLKPTALQKIKKGTSYSSDYGLGLNDDGCLGFFTFFIIGIIFFIICCGILGG
jgi:hypothetical protein